jgi:hypothetical protein
MKINYKNIGNISRKHEARFRKDHVIPIGRYVDSDLVLKLYHMIANKPSEEELDSKGKDLQFLISGKRHKNKIESYSGMGFAISTQNISDICIWDGKDLWVKTYSNSDLEGYREISRDKSPSIDKDEIDIYFFEKNAWDQYLNSNRTVKDKKAYLNQIFQK